LDVLAGASLGDGVAGLHEVIFGATALTGGAFIPDACHELHGVLTIAVSGEHALAPVSRLQEGKGRRIVHFQAAAVRVVDSCELGLQVIHA
jgi:hypothetical protein